MPGYLEQERKTEDKAFSMNKNMLVGASRKMLYDQQPQYKVASQAYD